MMALEHPHICKLLEVFEWDQCIYLVLEWLSGGTLLDIIDEAGPLQEHVARSIVKQVASALQYAHARGIAHLDVKPENICFVNDAKENPKVKLIDWGLAENFAQLKGGQMFREVGSYNYAAPEVLEVAFGMRPSGYSCACDLWSLGAVTYEMMCGSNPFWGDFDSMMSESLGFEQEQWMHASDDCKDIIVNLLRAQAENRLSITNVFEHSFITDARAESKEVCTGALSQRECPNAHQEDRSSACECIFGIDAKLEAKELFTVFLYARVRREGRVTHARQAGRRRRRRNKQALSSFGYAYLHFGNESG
jgi:serine/threonine protein kinase